MCWKCGAALTEEPLPLLRRAECRVCGAELHVCRMCVSHNPRVSDKCDEPAAEHPHELERANFCDYFRPRADAYVSPQAAGSKTARARLDVLFGGTADAGPQGDADAARNKLDGLFGADKKDAK